MGTPDTTAFLAGKILPERAFWGYPQVASSVSAHPRWSWPWICNSDAPYLLHFLSKKQGMVTEHWTESFFSLVPKGLGCLGVSATWVPDMSAQTRNGGPSLTIWLGVSSGPSLTICLSLYAVTHKVAQAVSWLSEAMTPLISLGASTGFQSPSKVTGRLHWMGEYHPCSSHGCTEKLTTATTQTGLTEWHYQVLEQMLGTCHLDWRCGNTQEGLEKWLPSVYI